MLCGQAYIALYLACVMCRHVPSLTALARQCITSWHRALLGACPVSRSYLLSLTYPQPVAWLCVHCMPMLLGFVFLLRPQVGDTIRIVFRNSLPFGANLFLGGALTQRDSSAPNATVDPGATIDYLWQVS